MQALGQHTNPPDILPHARCNCKFCSSKRRPKERVFSTNVLTITGGVRALAPQLFQLTHLTALYLNDNSLQRIPPDINQLVNLHTLDMSNNKLRALPAELGDLIQLRELHLHNNYLRVLPYDLGKLFHLQMLGLQGNPLSKEMLSIYNDSNGTAKLLTYLLDNMQDVFNFPRDGAVPRYYLVSVPSVGEVCDYYSMLFLHHFLYCSTDAAFNNFMCTRDF
ncbi:CCR4-NOT transcription complex subunit 6 like protein [Danaus plexippus plexippus]|uniref:CCR4-NOT transcription complex subunit 6 like protein n=1 Tax=Danaus plexippus plexippus TaxID=278856 RepID=A0A212ENE3_DANPL|nr:CCR4-NOT transcription complex subunit 6 like protein [Danaus plexippus plexippus]